MAPKDHWWDSSRRDSIALQCILICKNQTHLVKKLILYLFLIRIISSNKVYHRNICLGNLPILEEGGIQTKPWFNPSYIEIQGECNTKVSIIDFQDIRYVYFNGNFVRFIYQRNVHTWVVTRQTHSTWKKTMCKG